MTARKQRTPVPVVTDHFVNIYKPQEDVFTLPTTQVKGRGQCTFTYEHGKSYRDWRTNDHTFIKDHNNRWHCFGITKPWMPGDNSHAGEGLCFHAIAPETANGTFAETVKIHSWQDRPKIAEGGVGWAPGSIKIGAQYNLVGSQLDRMVSEDLENWTYAGKLKVSIEGVGGDVRDPHISVIDGVYHMVICCCDKVGLSTSEDFVTWTDMTVIFKPENDKWRTESPFLVPYDGRYYLFWTLWDTGDLTTSGYSTKTYVQCSESLRDFNGEPIAEFSTHAPNLIQDADGTWFMSSTDYPHRGISVAPLEWRTGRSDQLPGGANQH